MSSILLIGLIGVLLVIFLKNPTMKILGDNNKLVQKLRNAKWFQNHWITGTFLFVLNAVLFFSTCLLLYMLMHFFIPYLHLPVMFLAVIGSIFSWLVINKAWQGTKRNRLKIGAFGGSFYLIMTFIFVYWFVTLKPAFPGDDTFMATIGLLYAIIVTTVAFITCFVMTGFSNKKS